MMLHPAYIMVGTHYAQNYAGIIGWCQTEGLIYSTMCCSLKPNIPELETMAKNTAL